MCPTINGNTIPIPVCRSLIAYFNSVLTGNWNKNEGRLFWHFLKRILRKNCQQAKTEAA